MAEPAGTPGAGHEAEGPSLRQPTIWHTIAILPTWLAAVTLFVLMCMTFLDVMMRSILNNPIEIASELTRFFMAIIVFSSLPMVSFKGQHIVVDLLDPLFSRMMARIRDILLDIVCGVILLWPAYRVYELAERSAMFGDRTEYMELPTHYIEYFIATFTFLTAITFIVRGVLRVVAPFKDFRLMFEAAIGFVAVLVLVLLRMPIALSMGIVGLVGFSYMTSFKASLSMASRLIIDTAQDYGLSVVPLFILMGLFVNKGGLSRELYQVSYAFMGHFRGGLAMATIVACAGFSAICGSSLATAATMSKVAMPQMRKYNYADSLSTASIAAGGTLGILIPPSVILVIYGLLTETSIGSLFIAGIVPGLLGVLLYLAAVKYTITRNPVAGPAGERTSWSDRLKALRGVWAVLLLFFIVIGGLYGMFDFAPLNLTFSPTEAAGMGAAGAFLIALFRGTLTLRSTMQVLVETSMTAAALFTVLIGAWIFSNFVNLAGLPEGLRAFVSSTGLGPMSVMMMILLVYILLGMVFESLSMLLLTVPIFFPLVTSLGFDPVWFGIIVVVVVEISLITPPVGLNVFVLKGVVGDVSTGTIFRGVTPFWMVDILRLALLVAFPALVLFLPNSM